VDVSCDKEKKIHTCEEAEADLKLPSGPAYPPIYMTELCSPLAEGRGHFSTHFIHSFICLVFQRSTEVDMELVRYKNRYSTERVITIKYL